jgi:hypothetical protein
VFEKKSQVGRNVEKVRQRLRVFERSHKEVDVPKVTALRVLEKSHKEVDVRKITALRVFEKKSQAGRNVEKSHKG